MRPHYYRPQVRQLHLRETNRLSDAKRARLAIGEGERVECKVRATKTLRDEDPSARPVFSGYTVMESAATDKLPVGDYDLLTNGERIRFSRSDGGFRPRS